MTPVRKTVARYGAKGRTVRVFTEGALVRVKWHEGGTVRHKSWANTPVGRDEAKAWARAFADVREQLPTFRSARTTTRALWEAYTEAEFPHLRPRSRVLNADDWRMWELFYGRETVAEDASTLTIAKFRAALERQVRALTSVRRAVSTVKRVYRWGQANELLERNRVHLYRFKIAKGQQPESPGEYSADERAAILAQLDPTSSRQWRAHLALTLCFTQFARQNAVLHLRWEDVDWARGEVTWRAAWDKTGKEWTQHLRPEARAALDAAWDRAGSPTTGWVLPAGSSKNTGGETYTAQSLWAALRRAEAGAGIAHQARRATHGGRRGGVGDLIDQGIDPLTALEAVGDRSPEMLKHYRKARTDRSRSVLTTLDQPKGEKP